MGVAELVRRTLLVCAALGTANPPHWSRPTADLTQSPQTTPCTCDRFCRDECAPFASHQLPPGLPPPGQTLNLTLYRFTPRVIQSTLGNTNTGDLDGDLGFFLARFALDARCRHEPTNLRCFLAPWTAVVFARWRVEIDPGVGPYLACNPTYLNSAGSLWDLHHYICSQECVVPPYCSEHRENGTTGSDGQTTCFCARSNTTVGIMSNGSPLPSGFGGVRRAKHRPPRAVTLPPICRYGTSILPDNQCLAGAIGTTVIAGENLTAVLLQCCAQCVAPNCSGWSVTQSGPRFKCTVYSGNVSRVPGQDCVISATRDQLVGGSWNWGTMAISRGNWLSTPARGQCREGVRPGNGSGCTWRVIAPAVYVESACVHDRLASALVQADPKCFAALGKDRLSDEFFRCCWLLLNSDPVAARALWLSTIRPVFEAVWESSPAGCLISSGGIP